MARCRMELKDVVGGAVADDGGVNGGWAFGRRGGKQGKQMTKAQDKRASQGLDYTRGVSGKAEDPLWPVPQG